MEFPTGTAINVLSRLCGFTVSFGGAKVKTEKYISLYANKRIG
jgi:hypothetical protein